MAPSDELKDLKAHAASSHDFYALLNISPAAAENEIRRAYRRTALKYHPDKLQNPTPADIDKFHLLQIAYDVLSEPSVRQVYDNAREARDRKKRESEMLEGVRRKMKEDLESRERGVKRTFAATGLSTSVDIDDAEERLAQEIRRLAEDGRRRRQQKEELMRREVLEEEERREQEKEEKERGIQKEKQTRVNIGGTAVPEIERTVKVRWVREGLGSSLDAVRLQSLFSEFGNVETVFTMKDKKQRIGEKREKKLVATGVVVFASIVGAHAAVEDSKKKKGEEWDTIDSVFWASNKEPDLEAPSGPSPAPQGPCIDESIPNHCPKLDSSASAANNGAKKPPSFASFSSGTGPASGNTSLGSQSPSLEEVTLMRLKNAQKKRLEKN